MISERTRIVCIVLTIFCIIAVLIGDGGCKPWTAAKATAIELALDEDELSESGAETVA